MIKSDLYQNLDDKTKEGIKALLNTVWPSDDDVPHNLSYTPVSFYIEDRSYGAVLQFTLQSGNHIYKAAGLSSVVTNPTSQKEGFGLKVIQEATQWIINKSNADIAIFTCHPSLVPFYQKSGQWLVADNLVLKGNKSKDALSSTKLGVSILYQILSDNVTLQETVYLNFSNNEFI